MHSGTSTKLLGLQAARLYEAPGPAHEGTELSPQPAPPPSPRQGSSRPDFDLCQGRIPDGRLASLLGQAIDGVLMMSGFTDKLWAWAGWCGGPIVSRDGNQTPWPQSAHRRRMQGEEKGLVASHTGAANRIRNTCQGRAGGAGGSRISGWPWRCQGYTETPPHGILGAGPQA